MSDEREERRAENARGVELDLGDVQAIEELRNGTELHVMEDPEDDRFVQVIFRRPKAPGEKMVSYEGAEVALGKFIKMALAYAKGFGLAQMVSRGAQRIMMVSFDGVLMYAGEIEEPKSPIVHASKTTKVEH